VFYVLVLIIRFTSVFPLKSGFFETLLICRSILNENLEINLILRNLLLLTEALLILTFSHFKAFVSLVCE
jgi:hypothetical protein